MTQEYLKELSKTENLREFVNGVSNQLFNNKISYKTWLRLVNIYSELVNVPNIDGDAVMQLGVELYTSQVNFKDEEEKLMYDMLLPGLFASKIKNCSIDEFKYMSLIKSRVSAIQSYAKTKKMSVNEWLRIYDDFLVAYANLKDFNSELRKDVINEYIKALLLVKTVIGNNLDEMNYSYSVDKIKSLKIK